MEEFPSLHSQQSPIFFFNVPKIHIALLNDALYTHHSTPIYNHTFHLAYIAYLLDTDP